MCIITIFVSIFTWFESLDSNSKFLFTSIACISTLYFLFWVFVYFKQKALSKKYPRGTGKFTSVVIERINGFTPDTKDSDVLSAAGITGCKCYCIIGRYHATGNEYKECTRYKIEYWE